MASQSEFTSLKPERDRGHLRLLGRTAVEPRLQTTLPRLLNLQILTFVAVVATTVVVLAFLRATGSRADQVEAGRYTLAAAPPTQLGAIAEHFRWKDREEIAHMNVRPGDWPQWGGSTRRNNAPRARNIPSEWDAGEINEKTGEWNRRPDKNVKWTAKLGSQTYGHPVVANGKVFIGTNNGNGYLRRFPAEVDLGCLLCFDERTGDFLWQDSTRKLVTGRVHDWPMLGICSTPYADGDRLWYVNSRGEVVCLDAEGFRDNENDRPFEEEEVKRREGADVIWKFDMMTELGVSQHNMANCSVTCAGDMLFVCTSNGVDDAHIHLPAPEAPSFIALDRNTGRLLWQDNSPGGNVLHGQWSSPAYGLLGGEPQVIFAGGDGWLYSFHPLGDGKGNSKRLWKFDCNPKVAKYKFTGADRNHIIALPVIHDGLVYVPVGEDPEHGEGQGHLWCIDPTRRGDVSSELAVDANGVRLPPRRNQAVVPEQGERSVANPNSAAVWHYDGFDRNGNGRREFEETMHRSIASVAVESGMVVAVDFQGLVHCLDAKTGKLHWTHDVLAACWATPLIADGKIYVADEDGTVTILELSTRLRMINEVEMRNAIYTSPIVANGVLYIATTSQVFAIAAGAGQNKNRAGSE